MNTLKICVILFIGFTTFGMIVPPIVMNECLVPVAADAGHAGSVHLTVAPACRTAAQRILPQIRF